VTYVGIRQFERNTTDTSVNKTATRRQNGRSEVRIPSETRHASLQHVETGCGTRPAFYSTCNRVLSREERSRSVDLHEVPRISTTGAISLFPLRLLRGQGQRSRLTARKHTCTIPNHLLRNNEDPGNNHTTRLFYGTYCCWQEWQVRTDVPDGSAASNFWTDHPIPHNSILLLSSTANNTTATVRSDVLTAMLLTSGTLYRAVEPAVPDVSEDHTSSSSVSSTGGNYSSNSTAYHPEIPKPSTFHLLL
jgi:hypothetical protein